MIRPCGPSGVCGAALAVAGRRAAAAARGACRDAAGRRPGAAPRRPRIARRPSRVSSIRVVYAYPVRRRRPERRAGAADLRGRRRDRRRGGAARTPSASRASTASPSPAGRRRTSWSSGCRERGGAPGRRDAVRAASRTRSSAIRGQPRLRQAPRLLRRPDRTSRASAAQGGGTADGAGDRDRLPRDLRGRPDGGRRRARAAPRVRRAASRRAAATPARTRRASPLRQPRRHPLSVRRLRRRSRRSRSTSGATTTTAHPGGWLDVQDSRWLRLVDAADPLALAITGGGSVESDMPGVECSASCTTEWDSGARARARRAARRGSALRPLVGRLHGADSCALTLGAAAGGHGALFAPERFALTLSVAGKRRGDGRQPCAAPSSGAPRQRDARTRRCGSSPTAGTGWRFAGWAGACVRRPARARVPMTKATSVRRAVRQARLALSQVSSVVWRGAGLALRELAAELADGPPPLRHDVVVVDRLEVHLAREDEVVVGEPGLSGSGARSARRAPSPRRSAAAGARARRRRARRVA